jgi:hypothetical protein
MQTKTPTSSNQSVVITSSPTSGGLSSGEQAGLAIGIILLVAIALFISFWLYYKYCSEKQTDRRKPWLFWFDKKPVVDQQFPVHETTPVQENTPLRASTPIPPVTVEEPVEDVEDYTEHNLEILRQPIVETRAVEAVV